MMSNRLLIKAMQNLNENMLSCFSVAMAMRRTAHLGLAISMCRWIMAGVTLKFNTLIFFCAVIETQSDFKSARGICDLLVIKAIA
jgi:hypothetical protein